MVRCLSVSLRLLSLIYTHYNHNIIFQETKTVWKIVVRNKKNIELIFNLPLHLQNLKKKITLKSRTL